MLNSLKVKKKYFARLPIFKKSQKSCFPLGLRGQIRNANPFLVQEEGYVVQAAAWVRQGKWCDWELATSGVWAQYPRLPLWSPPDPWLLNVDMGTHLSDWLVL